MKPANPHILTINGGSSSIKFALFEAGDSLRRILGGGIDRIGQPGATLRVKGLDPGDNFSRPVKAPDHTVAYWVLPSKMSQGYMTACRAEKNGQNLCRLSLHDWVIYATPP